MIRILAVVVMAVACAAPVAPQSQPVQGERVRVTRTGGSTVVGEFRSATAEEVRLYNVATRREYIIPQSAVRSMERSTGRTRRFGRNFAIGVGVTSVVAGVASAASYSPCEAGGFGCLMHPESGLQALGMGLAGGALLGVPVGIVAGLVAKHDHWETIIGPERDDVALILAPAPGRRVTLGLRVSAK
ncbi:MAG TPA: hypothetical protein VMN60_14275 [Longimicrobiales bacterium]|nr:hypothetical protein [Longimicrobiales bacterium]